MEFNFFCVSVLGTLSFQSLFDHRDKAPQNCEGSPRLWCVLYHGPVLSLVKSLKYFCLGLLTYKIRIMLFTLFFESEKNSVTP